VKFCRRDFSPEERGCVHRGWNRSYRGWRFFVGGTSVPKKGAAFIAVETAPARVAVFCRRDFSPEERSCVLRG